ncbi:hypothetical protein CVD28_19775 [Bacillus sp. M6-12]|uniref:HAAS signaling domain-containing protein n=1 Tax=Bacillus sp. M6-12 TaxID=2054166 RepID=UPI000C75E4A7|nr:DUF1700 domain-containing protein [Bacillus sp. M6-12]PLS15981.1 hypothetical protein CVD28_19775 [Bacillus sp. M6-12]
MKNEFLNTLEAGLRHIPETDREEMLYDFKEHFEVGFAEGRTYKELSEELGSPKEILKDLLTDYTISKAESEKSVKNVSRAMVAVISLSFLNLIFVLGPVLTIVGVYIALCAVAIAFTLSPLAILTSGYFTDEYTVRFFTALTLSSLGVLLGAGAVSLGKFLYNLILKYIKMNSRIIKGEKAV